MKKITLFFASAIIAGLTFASCSSDDDNSNNEASIVGKWNFSTQKITSNGVVVNEGPYNGNEAGCNTDYVEFFENNTAATGDYDENCELNLTSSNYTIDGNTLSVTNGEISASFDIVIANSTTLVLKNTYQYEGATFTTEVAYLKAE